MKRGYLTRLGTENGKPLPPARQIAAAVPAGSRATAAERSVTARNPGWAGIFGEQ
jgi:hypothetical protein